MNDIERALAAEILTPSKDPTVAEVVKRIRVHPLTGMIVYVNPTDGSLTPIKAGGRKVTSKRMSEIAGKFVGMSHDDMVQAVHDNPLLFFGEVRSLAGSVLSQDESRG
jgi:hypothetical protein